jgi:hypothetical protein
MFSMYYILSRIHIPRFTCTSVLGGQMCECLNILVVKLDHKNNKPRQVAEIHETNFFHIKFLGRIIKGQNGPVLPPAQFF